jgi:hypothetical protein
MKLATILSIATLTFVISGCSHFGGQKVVVDTTCSVMTPMRCSRSDTPETLDQCRRHNAVYDRLCK